MTTDYKYPYGYSGNPQGMGVMLTWDQMLTKSTVKNLHPEFQRRFHALIEFGADCGVPLGCGTGWRVQPNPPPPGFAKPGNSWHESCPVNPVSCTALAIDTVPNVSWSWMENNVKAYGLRTFKYVDNEPWHIQPVEISTSRKYATTLPPLQTWPLPGTIPPIPQQGSENHLYKIVRNLGDPQQRTMLSDLMKKTYVDGEDALAVITLELTAKGMDATIYDVRPDQMKGYGLLEHPIQGLDEYGALL